MKSFGRLFLKLYVAQAVFGFVAGLLLPWILK